jgi:hypothetical protein
MVWIVRNTSSGRGSRAFSTPIRRSASASIDGMMPAWALSHQLGSALREVWKAC